MADDGEMRVTPTAQPFFALEALPDAARDALFAFLTRPEAARACCVSRAWNRVFCTAVRHLWADITFDRAHFGRMHSSDAVVYGAAAKAGDALRCLSDLPDWALRLIPGLKARHPLLERERMDDCDLFVSDVSEATAACDAVRELSNVRLFVTLADCCHHPGLHALLRHGSLRLRVLDMDILEETETAVGTTLLLPVLTAALRAHAATLRTLTVPNRLGEQQVDASAAVDDFAEALAGASALEDLDVRGLFTAAAFHDVARALERRAPLRVNFALCGDDIEHLAADVAAHLLPSALRSLLLDGLGVDPACAQAEHALVVSLRSDSMLDALSVAVYDERADCVLELFDALPMARLVTLECIVATDEQMERLGPRLPPLVQRLAVLDIENREVSVAALSALLDGAARARALRQLRFDCDGWSGPDGGGCVRFSPAGLGTLAAFIRDNDSLVELGFYALADPDEKADYADARAHVAAALWANVSLREWHLDARASSEDVRFLALALHGNRGLQRVYARLVPPPDAATVPAPAIAALAAALSHNATLRLLRISLLLLPHEDRLEHLRHANNAFQPLRAVPRVARGDLELLLDAPIN